MDGALTQQAKPAVSRFKLIAAFAAVYFLWGSTYLFIHFALEDIKPFIMAATRFMIAGTILYAWTRLRGEPAPTRTHWRNGILLGGLFFLGGNGAVVWSQQRLPSGIVALIVAIVPLFIVLLDWLRPPHNRPRPSVLIGVFVGLAGLALLVGPDALRGDGPLDLAALAVLTGGSLSWATGALFAQRADLPKSHLITASLELLGGGALLAIASLIAREPWLMDWQAISLGPILSVVYLITFGSIIGFTAFGWLVRVAPPSRVATYAYVNPVVAMMLGWLFAGERFGTRTLIASAVILAGVALITAGTTQAD